MSVVSCKKQATENIMAEKENHSLVETAGVTALAGFTEYQVSPKFGTPSSTNYVFQISDPTNSLGSTSGVISVKLYERATGVTTYKPMTLSSGFWTTSTQLTQNGWYDYRYVYTSNYQPISGNPSYEMCNTRTNYVVSGTSSIRWPFGADGSSWSNRLGWNGGSEPGGCGNGPGAGLHTDQGCYAKDQQADDWNKNTASCGSPTLDLGATVKSPLDGKVVYVGNDGSSYGNRVDIEQTTSSGATIRFRIAHLNSTSITLTSWVKAGVTNIGTVGNSGVPAQGPHAHCVLYLNGGGCYSPLAFKFNAL